MFIQKHTQMFIEALFKITKTWKEPKCPSPSEQINKLWYNHIMEYYSRIQTNELLRYTTIWMKPYKKEYILHDSHLYKILGNAF